MTTIFFAGPDENLPASVPDDIMLIPIEQKDNRYKRIPVPVLVNIRDLERYFAEGSYLLSYTDQKYLVVYVADGTCFLVPQGLTCHPVLAIVGNGEYAWENIRRIACAERFSVVNFAAHYGHRPRNWSNECVERNVRSWSIEDFELPEQWDEHLRECPGCVDTFYNTLNAVRALA